MINLKPIERALLNRVQSNFPITERPFQTIAHELEILEEDVIEMLKELKKKGFIRRIGGNFVPEKLGFVSTLCAAKVPLKKIDVFTKTVNKFKGVTHNYQRDNEFNIWFTFIAPSMEEIDKNLLHISKKTGVLDIINLPATNVFKIKAQFDL